VDFPPKKFVMHRKHIQSVVWANLHLCNFWGDNYFTYRFLEDQKLKLKQERSCEVLEKKKIFFVPSYPRRPILPRSMVPYTVINTWENRYVLPASASSQDSLNLDHDRDILLNPYPNWDQDQGFLGQRKFLWSKTVLYVFLDPLKRIFGL
jgi:hypothetical protein